MHDALIFNLTMVVIGLILILMMWIGLWAYFDMNDEDTEVNRHEKRRNRS